MQVFPNNWGLHTNEYVFTCTGLDIPCGGVGGEGLWQDCVMGEGYTYMPSMNKYIHLYTTHCQSLVEDL